MAQPVELSLPELLGGGPVRECPAGAGGGLGSDPAPRAAGGVRSVEQCAGLVVVQSEDFPADVVQAGVFVPADAFGAQRERRVRVHRYGYAFDSGDPAVSAASDVQVQGLRPVPVQRRVDGARFAPLERVVFPFLRLVPTERRFLDLAGCVGLGSDVRGQLGPVHPLDVFGDGSQPVCLRHAHRLSLSLFPVRAGESSV